MTLEELSARVTEWTGTRKSEARGGLVSGLAEYLYLNMDRYRLEWIDEDRRSDFFSWFYPKFGGLIDKFDPGKASFGTYLYWNVRMSWKSFIRSSFSNQARERVLEAEERTRLTLQDSEWRDPDSWVTETKDYSGRYEPSDQPVQANGLSPKQREIRSRKILLLACKSSAFLEDRDIVRVARETGYGEANLRQKVEELKKACKERTLLVDRSRERVNALYFRIQRCLYEMRYLDPGSSRYDDLRRECGVCRKRLDAAKRQAARHFRSPSNRLLARILGIPRGTVDSTLASARPDGYAEPT